MKTKMKTNILTEVCSDTISMFRVDSVRNTCHDLH